VLAKEGSGFVGAGGRGVRVELPGVERGLERRVAPGNQGDDIDRLEHACNYTQTHSDMHISG
jgi:hypothetical protein